tara:strand:- start:772 stop:1968 length:1197 start_codon:yes stop_codon:yes gene_type:complete
MDKLNLYYKAIITLLQIANDRGFENNYHPNLEIVKHQFNLFKNNTLAFDMHFVNKTKLVILFLNEDAVNNFYLLENRITTTVNIYKLNKNDDIIIVYNQNDITASKLNKLYDKFQNHNTRLLSLQFLKFNVARHRFVPKHQKTTQYEISKLKKKYNLHNLQNLPHILISDPQCKYHGFRIGDVIKITRKSKTNTNSIVYRIVVDNDMETDNLDTIMNDNYNFIKIEKDIQDIDYVENIEKKKKTKDEVIKELFGEEEDDEDENYYDQEPLPKKTKKIEKKPKTVKKQDKDKVSKTKIKKQTKKVNKPEEDIKSKDDNKSKEETKTVYTTNVKRNGKVNKGKSVLAGDDIACKFPFKYKRKLVSECIEGKDGKWCATEKDKDNKMISWGYCKEDEGKKK